MPKAKKKSSSPYVKYGKSPYRYSEEYQHWLSATLKGHEAEARRWGQLHSRKFLRAEGAERGDA